MLFSEQNFSKKSGPKGSIEVICGSMFSGKTEELIRRLRRAQIAHLKVEIYKPKVDNRYQDDAVVSHDNNAISSTVVTSADAILKRFSDTQVIGIDEAQFFDEQLVMVCNKLANSGLRVIVAGLDMDFKGRPFGPMPALLSVAEHITKVHAVCVCCGGPAVYSYRTKPNENQLLIGEKESYEPRCRTCYRQS